MVGVLGRKLFRDLWASKGVLLAIMSMMAVGVACLVSMGSAYVNLGRAQWAYYAQCRMADFWIDLKKYPLILLNQLAQTPGIRQLQSRIAFYVTVGLPGAERPINGLVLSLPDRRQPMLNDIVLCQGGYFTQSRQNELIVNEAFARYHRLRPGQRIQLVLNNRLQEMEIVGTAMSCEFVYLLAPGAILPQPEHFGLFYIKQSYAEEVFDFEGAANQLLGLLQPGVRPGPVLSRLEEMLEDYGVITVTPLEDQASHKYLSQEIQGLRSFGLVMPVMFLGVAVVVLHILLSRLAEQQRTVLGTLKALGYSDLEVSLHFLQLAWVVALVGAAAGCGLGYGLAELLTAMYRQFYEFPALENHFYLGIHLAGVLVSLVCATLGSLRGVRMVLRLQPAEAMRPRPPKQGGPVPLERIGWLWNRLSSGWRMVLRHICRTPLRTAGSMFAAAMGSSVLVSGLMMGDATNFLVDFQFHRLLRSDVELAFQDERGREALEEAARLPGVDLAEPVLQLAGTFWNGPYQRKGAITGLAHDAQLTVPSNTEGQAIALPRRGLLMTRKLAELLHLAPGDTVCFRPVRGDRREYRLPVAQLADSYLGTAVYADIAYLSRLIGQEFALSGVQIRTDRKPEHLAELLRRLKEYPSLQAVNLREELVQKLQTTIIQNMWGFIVTLILFAGVIFFGSILNAALVSLSERGREVATLQVLGYGPWEVGSLLLRESLVVSMLGALVGMPIGYGLTILASLSYDSEMFRFPVIWSWGTAGWAGGFAFLFTLIAYGFVQRVVHRFDWLEALQAKE